MRRLVFHCDILSVANAADVCHLFIIAVESNYRLLIIVHVLAFHESSQLDGWCKRWRGFALVSEYRGCIVVGTTVASCHLLSIFVGKVRHSLLRSPINESNSVACTMLHTTIIRYKASHFCFFVSVATTSMMMMMIMMMMAQ